MSNDIELPPLPKRLAVSVWPAYSEGQIEDYAREAVRLDRAKRFIKERAQLDAEWVALRGMREAEKRTSVEAMRKAMEIAADQILHGRALAYLTITNALRAAPAAVPQAQPAENPDALDAARYRWLRTGDSDDAQVEFWSNERRSYVLLFEDDLDAAIDAAMKEES